MHLKKGYPLRAGLIWLAAFRYFVAKDWHTRTLVRQNHWTSSSVLAAVTEKENDHRICRMHENDRLRVETSTIFRAACQLTPPYETTFEIMAQATLVSTFRNSLGGDVIEVFGSLLSTLGAIQLPSDQSGSINFSGSGDHGDDARSFFRRCTIQNLSSGPFLYLNSRTK